MVILFIGSKYLQLFQTDYNFLLEGRELIRLHFLTCRLFVKGPMPLRIENIILFICLVILFKFFDWGLCENGNPHSINEYFGHFFLFLTMSTFDYLWWIWVRSTMTYLKCCYQTCQYFVFQNFMSKPGILKQLPS